MYFKTIVNVTLFAICLFAQGEAYDGGQGDTVLITEADDGSMFNNGKYNGHEAKVAYGSRSQCYVSFWRTTKEGSCFTEKGTLKLKKTWIPDKYLQTISKGFLSDWWM